MAVSISAASTPPWTMPNGLRWNSPRSSRNVTCPGSASTGSIPSVRTAGGRAACRRRWRAGRRARPGEAGEAGGLLVLPVIGAIGRRSVELHDVPPVTWRRRADVRAGCGGWRRATARYATAATTAYSPAEQGSSRVVGAGHHREEEQAAGGVERRVPDRRQGPVGRRWPRAAAATMVKAALPTVPRTRSRSPLIISGRCHRIRTTEAIAQRPEGRAGGAGPVP